MSIISKSAIKNTDNVSVAGNEMLYTHQINRNIKKLVENDEKLNELFKKVNGSVTIREYIENYSYGTEDLVWFFDETISELKILRCIRQGNTDKPFFKDGSYEASGWKDENEQEELSSFGIDKFVQKKINGKLVSHEGDKEYHKYGSLKNFREDVDQILMSRDLSNRSSDRTTMLYPFRNRELSPDNTIINGHYRLYDNGLIEYDIVFRLGYRGTETIDGIDYDQIVCNDMTLDVNNDYFNSDNSKYFYATTDMDIFAYQNQSKNNYSMTDTTVERNRNDYVNVYGGTISFPVPFKDTNYMVFTNDVMAYDRNNSNSTIEPCANSITFLNKRNESISPMLITFSKDNFSNTGYNSTHGNLSANRFHCKIIGFQLS
jgi:hypothetical protein